MARNAASATAKTCGDSSPSCVRDSLERVNLGIEDTRRGRGGDEALVGRSARGFDRSGDEKAEETETLPLEGKTGTARARATPPRGRAAMRIDPHPRLVEVIQLHHVLAVFPLLEVALADADRPRRRLRALRARDLDDRVVAVHGRHRGGHPRFVRVGDPYFDPRRDGVRRGFGHRAACGDADARRAVPSRVPAV
eukprot:31144-Pelagococcus_subviridis.AAC.9